MEWADRLIKLAPCSKERSSYPYIKYVEHRLGHRDAILGDLGHPQLGVEQHVAALGPQGDGGGRGDPLDAFEQVFAGLLPEVDIPANGEGNLHGQYK